MIVEIISFFGILLAVTFRTFIPVIKKMQEPGFKWDQSYTVTAFIAFIIGGATAGLAFPAFPIPATVVSWFSLFWLAFGYGWGLNDLMNKILIDIQTPAAPATPAK